MPPVTYHVVVTFDQAEGRDLKPGEPKELSTAGAAMRHAALIAHQYAGVVAFSGTRDPRPAIFEDALIFKLERDLEYAHHI